MVLDLKNKKIFKIISFILIIFIVWKVLNYIARIAISISNKINGSEANVIIFQIVTILICLAMTGICCYISATLSRKKNRDVLFWIFAAIIANVFAVFYLYKLPSLKKGE
jgi:cytochrome bd-type quinol oxidase subunit 2